MGVSVLPYFIHYFVGLYDDFYSVCKKSRKCAGEVKEESSTSNMILQNIEFVAKNIFLVIL